MIARAEPDYAEAAAGAPAARPGDPRTLSFNLSHSGELTLCAFTSLGAIGVDVEVARDGIDCLGIVARVFGAQEARRLACLDPQLRAREFLRLWTRHEAALKCHGTGFATATAMHSSSVDWVAELDVGVNAAAAVASERRPSSVQLWKIASP